MHAINIFSYQREVLKSILPVGQCPICSIWIERIDQYATMFQPLPDNRWLSLEKLLAEQFFDLITLPRLGPAMIAGQITS